MRKEINVSKLVLPQKRTVSELKLPQKRTVQLNRRAQAMIAEKKFENIKTGIDEIDKTAVNNGFLWLLAVVPFFWLFLFCLIVRNALDIGLRCCSLWTVFFNVEYITGRFESLLWTVVILILVMNTIFAWMDNRELSMRGKSAGSGFVCAMAFCIVPIYLWVRGKPTLNRGCCNVFPYILWWCGFIMIDLLTCNFVAIGIELIIAAFFVLVADSVECAVNESHESIDDYAAPKPPTQCSDNVNDALGISD